MIEIDYFTVCRIMCYLNYGRQTVEDTSVPAVGGGISVFKARVHCFSTQVVMIKYFLLNPEKIFAQIRALVFEKNAKSA